MPTAYTQPGELGGNWKEFVSLSIYSLVLVSLFSLSLSISLSPGSRGSQQSWRFHHTNRRASGKELDVQVLYFCFFVSLSSQLSYPELDRSRWDHLRQRRGTTGSCLVVVDIATCDNLSAGLHKRE
jgi:hypothetical protein